MLGVRTNRRVLIGSVLPSLLTHLARLAKVLTAQIHGSSESGILPGEE